MSLVYNAVADNDRALWASLMLAAGKTLVAGSFEQGATVASVNDAVWYESAARCYVWNGATPLTVPAGSSPNSTGGLGPNAWVEVASSPSVIQLPLAQAKARTYNAGQLVRITDVGFLFRFNPNRTLLDGFVESTITVDDELHKLVVSGGMLEFVDYGSLSVVEERNYAAYQARMRIGSSIGLVSYGDSITWGQRPDGGQSVNPYPAVIANTMSTRTRSTWTQQNLASPGDRALTQYIRTMQDGTTGHISTIMLGINDTLYSTNNGEFPENITGNTLYGVNNYITIMRKFVARELLRGRCVVILGVTQFVSLNLGPMGNMTAPYLVRTYDMAAKQVAAEFGCMFVDTRRDITQQFGISESCHDGIHLRDDFLPVIGKRFACVFMQQDYKNPVKLKTGDVFIPNYLHQPIMSNRILQLSPFQNGTSPPFGGGVSNPDAMGVLLPNDATGGSVTFAFYLDSDSAVIYPSIHSDGSAYSFDLILDDGAMQPDYPSDVEIIPVLRDRQYILSGRSIAGSASKNRSTERYSQITTACYMHVTTRGWHMITFNMGMNAGVAAVEGLVLDSWTNVKNNDVFGGISGSALWNSSGTELVGLVTGVTNLATGVFEVGISNLVVENYRVEVESTEDTTPLVYRVVYKSNNSFRVLFWDAAGAAVTPTSFRVRVLGGK